MMKRKLRESKDALLKCLEHSKKRALLTVVFEPLIAKLLKRINTSVDVEDNGEIAAIDISEEG